MAAYSADNLTQIPFMGAYGNKASFTASLAVLGTYAQTDTVDLMRLPGGARLISGLVVVATAVSTSTIAIGVRYADGTSTGGTTGTAVLSGAGIVLTTALVPQAMNFVPFTNDVDTIVYATIASPGFAPGANIAFAATVDYEPTGTK